MSSKPRLPNKTGWALTDIVNAAALARGEWRDAMDCAEKYLDPLLLSALGNLLEQLTVIEIKAQEALQGKYNGG